MLLTLHGLIHLIGFLQNKVRISGFSGKTIFDLSATAQQVFPVIWLMACLMFLASAGFLWRSVAFWPYLTLGAVILSQFLVVLYWPEAKAGTIANILLAFGAVFALGFARMEQQKEDAIEALQAENQVLSLPHIERSDLDGLPDPVQTWLVWAKIVGAKPVQQTHLKQHNFMRLKPDAKWVKASAEQWFGFQNPGFVWQTSMPVFPMVSFYGLDRFSGGKGGMDIKAWGTLPVVHADGPEINQGTLVRMLAEILWTPTAAFASYIRWKSLDSTHAKAIITIEGQEAEGVFTFSQDGMPMSFEAMRYYNQGKTTNLEKWEVKTLKTASLNGFFIPVQSQVSWKLKEGDFHWMTVTLTEINYQ